MSVISKIREKSGLAVAIVALGLILFLVGGDILGPNSMIMGKSREKIGEIAGEDVSATEYNAELKALEDDFQIQNQKSPNEQERQQMQEQAWNQLIFKRLYKPQADELGLAVPEDEQVDMVQGTNIHPAIKQAFTNPQTGQFDKAQIKNFLANINRAEPRQQAAWVSFEQKLPDDRLRTKYEGLLTKTEYVTRVQAEREYAAAQSKAQVQYLFVNYSAIPDSTIKVDDAELNKYLKAHSYRYKAQDNRGLEYVQFELKPSADDSAAIKKELGQLVADFGTTTNDTAFAAANSDSPSKLQTLSASDLPAELAPQASSLAASQIYGPYLANGVYTLYKVVSVGAEGAYVARASHILFKADAQTPDSAKVTAKANAQRVLNEIKGGADFADRARTYGTDGTAQQGGDLGWFDQTRMVKPFGDAVFNYAGTGLLPNLIETDFGYHIVKITGAKTNVKYKVVTITKNITTGDATEEAIYNKAAAFKAAAGATKEGFEKAVTEQKLSKVMAPNVAKNGFGVNDITEAREIVRWAYNEDTKIGDVSNVFETPTRYVVAVLTKKSNEGNATLDDVRDAVTAEVRKQKKAEQIITKLGKGSLEDMAKRYGAGAVVNTAPDVLLSSGAFQDVGYDPELIGRILGSKKGTVLGPVQAESGVAVIKVNDVTPAKPADKTTDLTSFKTQIEQRSQGRTQYFIGEALKEVGKVKDNRVRFY